MPSPKNPHLSAHKIDFPNALLIRIKEIALKEDENVSSLIRRVMAEYVGWEGPVRNITNYVPHADE
ncbi:hypothetical protein [uncultured Desulfosarcina sp.]|uniref:hypothetical protein n=1 Tax=uncultured Desulfosarcina sp. TaxID=218289 RepID=UPI0029C71433|nr:hypothetical protein [uncultured Desulfosarcina sp.]